VYTVPPATLSSAGPPSRRTVSFASINFFVFFFMSSSLEDRSVSHISAPAAGPSLGRRLFGIARLLGRRVDVAPDRFLDPVEKPLLAVAHAIPAVGESEHRLPEQRRRLRLGNSVAPQEIVDLEMDLSEDLIQILLRRTLGGSGGHRWIVAHEEKKIAERRNLCKPVDG
jgi:hypothetical protein